MKYTMGAAPILKQNQKVIAKLKDLELINGTIVGIATVDIFIAPMYIIECTDGKLPSTDYPYSSFVCPLALIDLV